jgi:malonate transporter and related proteins
LRAWPLFWHFTGFRFFPPPVSDRSSVILDSLISVFGIIAVGWVLRQTLLDSDETWRGFETISFYVLIPVLLANTLASAKLGNVPVARLGAALVLTILIFAALLLAARSTIERACAINSASFTAIFQTILRWNTFVALGMAANLYGTEGVTLAAVAMTAMIPLLNVLSVLVLRKYATGSGSLFRGLATNPFIVGTAIGLILNVTGLPIPRAVGMSMDILGRCALGATLLLVGAGLRIHDLKKPSSAILLGIFVRVIAVPLVGYALGKALGLSGNSLAIVLICLGVPTAGGAYVLAKKMGGDAPLVAAITTGQTLVAMVTLPLLLAFLT